MHVLFVTHNYPRRSGDFAGVFLHTLSRYLLKESVSVSVVAPHDNGAPEFETVDGVNVYRARYGSDESETFAYRGNMHRQLMSVGGLLKFRRMTRVMEDLAERVVREKNVDLIHSHWIIPSAPVVRKVAQKRGVPYLISSHGTDMRILDKLFPARIYVRSALNDSQALTVVSSFLKSNAVRLFPELESKIEICPLPNDAAIFYRDESIQRQKNLVVSVTRFTNQKRVGVLIDACARLAKSGTDFALEVYGAGPLESEVRNQIASQNLQEKVRIHQPVTQSELRGIYNRARAVVLNSVDEGFGLTLVEGALCGALPVGVRSGGITDIVQHEQTGLLADPDDPQSLAEQLQRGLNDDGLVKRLALNAQQSALSQFTGEAVARRFINVYRKALGN